MWCITMKFREKVNEHHVESVEKLDDQKGVQCSGERKQAETITEPETMHLITTVLL